MRTNPDKLPKSLLLFFKNIFIYFLERVLASMKGGGAKEQ